MTTQTAMALYSISLAFGFAGWDMAMWQHCVAKRSEGDHGTVRSRAPVYPWIARWQWLDIDWKKYPHLKIWYEQISERPTVQRGLCALRQL